MDSEPLFEETRMPVKGPLCCSEHGKDVSFVFDYATMTYKHVWKNGGLCKCEVTVKPIQRTTYYRPPPHNIDRDGVNPYTYTLQ